MDESRREKQEMRKREREVRERKWMRDRKKERLIIDKAGGEEVDVRGRGRGREQKRR